MSLTKNYNEVFYKNINQKESSITPEKYFYNKRKFLKIFGVVGLSTILSSKISFSLQIKF